MYVERKTFHPIEEMNPGRKPRVGLMGAAERTLQVTEHLRSEEVLVDGSAVHGDKWTVPARTQAVNHPGGNLFA